ncbi:uncharacterized protein LOC134842488 isoform X2 [Symsagittifera roscoffensis]|uniref:uncharacterized protein LOC134842488 isoform X2 n=1 Tax=Symsagittifera roscoffensis TaxID=84072 RepID=UPI00307B4897
MLSSKELEALLHQAEVFTPHLRRQLRDFAAAKCNSDSVVVRVMDLGCGPCPTIHTVVDEIQKKNGKKLEFVGVDLNLEWVNYCKQRYIQYPCQFVQTDLSSHPEQISLSRLTYDSFELGVALFSVQALNSLFDSMHQNVFIFVEFKFILIHAFMITKRSFENSGERCSNYFRNYLAKSIQTSFDIYSSLSCPVELNEETSQQILKTVEERLGNGNHNIKKKRIAADTLQGNVHFVSLLLINKKLTQREGTQSKI